MSVDTSGGHSDMDYREHERTYAGFIQAIKISVALIVLLLIGMAIFIA